VAPTFGDARDVNMEGESGLLAALHVSRGYRGWNRSQGELFLSGGGRVFCDGADDGAYRIQGKNLAGLWADEIGLWRRWHDAWDESIAFAVRIPPARIIATGTPKRGHPLTKRLLADPTVAHTLLRTMDNAANLSPAALRDLLRRYEGTTLGRQELEGEQVEDAEGALWKRSSITYGEGPLTARSGTVRPDYQRVVVAVDPAVSYGPDSDETGIIVGARGADGLGYILDDQSGRYAPAEWASRAIAAYEHYQADAIVGEVNNGGDLVGANLTSSGYRGRFVAVHASRGKLIRAEPVAGLYEQAKVKHARPFPELEDQLCNYTADSLTSPDRLDALVWGMWELFLAHGYVSDGQPLSMIG